MPAASNAKSIAPSAGVAPALRTASNPWLPKTVVIDEIVPEYAGVATYHLRFRDPSDAAAYRFRPGQFNMLYVPGAGESAISLSADAASTARWAHTIRTAGVVTTALAAMQPGDTVGLRGPFGSAWPMEHCRGRDVVLVAGGIGLAPLRPAIYELLSGRAPCRSMTLLCGARTPDTMLYRDELPQWAARKMVVQTTVDRADSGWTGNVGVVPLLLDRLPLPDPTNTIVLTCGPEVMMDYSIRSALARGVPKDQVWLSSERNMQCAVGLCGHCQWGPEFVCKDGPVFRYDRVADWLPFRDF